MFQCDKCGLCCRSLSGIDLFKDLDRGDGICIHFDEKTNLCKIYDSRPLLCKVDEYYDHYFSSLMTREEYEQLNYAACVQLKQHYSKSILY